MSSKTSKITKRLHYRENGNVSISGICNSEINMIDMSDLYQRDDIDVNIGLDNRKYNVHEVKLCGFTDKEKEILNRVSYLISGYVIVYYGKDYVKVGIDKDMCESITNRCDREMNDDIVISKESIDNFFSKICADVVVDKLNSYKHIDSNFTKIIGLMNLSVVERINCESAIEFLTNKEEYDGDVDDMPMLKFHCYKNSAIYKNGTCNPMFVYIKK